MPGHQDPTALCRHTEGSFSPCQPLAAHEEIRRQPWGRRQSLPACLVFPSRRGSRDGFSKAGPSVLEPYSDGAWDPLDAHLGSKPGLPGEATLQALPENGLFIWVIPKAASRWRCELRGQRDSVEKRCETVAKPVRRNQPIQGVRELVFTLPSSYFPVACLVLRPSLLLRFWGEGPQAQRCKNHRWKFAGYGRGSASSC